MTHATYEIPVLLVDDIEPSKRFYQGLFKLEIQHDYGENIVFKDTFCLWQRERGETIIFGGSQEPSLSRNPWRSISAE